MNSIKTWIAWFLILQALAVCKGANRFTDKVHYYRRTGPSHLQSFFHHNPLRRFGRRNRELSSDCDILQAEKVKLPVKSKSSRALSIYNCLALTDQEDIDRNSPVIYAWNPKNDYYCRPSCQPGMVIDFRYEILEKIGGGGYGSIFLARDHKTRKNVAIKVSRYALEDNHDSKHILEKEAAAMFNITRQSRTGRKAVLRPISLITREYQSFMVMPARDGPVKDLTEKYSWHARPEGRWLLLKAFAGSVLQALHCLKRMGLSHCDIKPNNVLYRELKSRRHRHSPPAMELADFGLVTKFGRKSVRGTRGYTPYNMLLESSADLGPSTDRYGLGMSMIELSMDTPNIYSLVLKINGKLIRAHRDYPGNEEVQKEILNAEMVPLISYISAQQVEALVDFIVKLLQPNDDAEPLDFLKHKFFRL